MQLGILFCYFQRPLDRRERLVNNNQPDTSSITCGKIPLCYSFQPPAFAGPCMQIIQGNGCEELSIFCNGFY